jgi:predicted ATP-grasp superfamily ATP-dependent carboligase
MLQRAYRVTTPLWEIVGIECDKRLTHEHVGAIGVDGPCWRECVLGRTGVAWTHASRDVVSAQQMVCGALSPSQYWALPRSAAFAAFAADNPLPGILDLPVLIARMLRRRIWKQGQLE